MHCENPQQRKIVLSDFIFSPGLSYDSSEHIFQPRLPATPPTCHSNRGISFLGMLGSWVGAERPRTRGKSFSGIGPDDCEALTTAFFWDSCINLCCHQLDFLRLYFNSEHFGVQSLDFENSSQNTSIVNWKHRCDSVLVIFVKTVGIDALCQQLQTIAAQTYCIASSSCTKPW